MVRILERPLMHPGSSLFFAGLAALAILYVLGLDQGLLLSLVQGSVAFDQNFIHELVHDGRHAAGFPCH